MNLFQLASRGIDLDALPDESAPEREPLAFEPSPAGSRFAVPQEFDAAFQAAGDEYGVDPDVLRAMAFAESRFRPDVISGQVKSRTGAAGLMQFMPGTAERFGINPLDPVESIFGAAAYMRANLEKFDGDYGKAVAAYNWGENRKAYDAEDWQSLAPSETQGYLKTVFGAADELKLRAPQASTEAAPAAKVGGKASPELTPGEAAPFFSADRAKDTALGIAGLIPGMGGSAAKPTGYAGVLAGAQAVSDLPSTSKAPVSKEARKAVEDAWDAATPEQRSALESKDGWVGQLARERAGVFERADAGAFQSPVAKKLDPRVESRKERLAMAGENPAFAERAAIEGAQRGVAPGDEVRALGGTVQPSKFDFDTKQAFDPKQPVNGLNNPIVRGLAKGGLGAAKAVAGYGQFLSDVYGLDNAALASRGAGDSLRSKEDAIGESGTVLERNLEGAISSIAQQLPLMATGSEAISLAGMGLQSFGQEYSDGRSKGQTIEQATQRASAFAAFEVLGEKFGIKGNLSAIKSLTHGKTDEAVMGFLSNTLKREIPGELLTTTGQFATDKLGPDGVALNPKSTVDDYLHQVRDTIVQTVMQGGITSGGSKAIGSTMSAAAKVRQDRINNDPSKALAQALDEGQFSPAGVSASVADALRTERVNGAGINPAATVAPKVEDQPTVPTAPVVPPQGLQQAPGPVPAAPTPSDSQSIAQQILEAEAAQPQATGLAAELEVLRARSAPAPDFTQRSTTPQAQPGSVPVTGGLAAELQALRARSSPQEAANAPQRTPSDTQQQTKATSAQAADVAGVNAPVPAADLSGAGAGAAEADGVEGASRGDPAPVKNFEFATVEQALTAERDASMNEIEDGWILSGKRRRQTPVERAIESAVNSVALDAVNARKIFDVAVQAGRFDVAEYATQRAENYAKSMNTTPGVSKDSPKYEAIKQDLARRKAEATAQAAALRQDLNARQASPAPVDVNAGAALAANVPQPAQPGTQASQTPSAQGAAQAAGQPIAASVRLGREQTPLSEGGKPFKTRKAAGDAKKLQPMMRVVPVEGGYALAEKTPAQLAAEAKAARRLSQPKTGTAGAPLAAHEFIAAEGGLSAIAASDLGIDDNPRVGNRRLFAGRGRGLSMEQATQKLIADGYLGEGATLNDAYALIKTSISRPQYTADGIERIAQAEANAQFDDYLAAQEESASDGDPWSDTQPVALDDFSDDMLESSGYDAAPDAIKAEVRALLEMANALGIDTESIMIDAHEQTINATEQDYYAAAKSALETAIARSNGDRRTPAGSEGQGQSGAATGPAAQGLNQPVALDQQAQAATENVALEPLELASQTPAEAAALQETQEQAAKAEAAAKRAADAQASKDEDRKRIAQASVRAADEFELGQDPLDSLTGQGGMFDAPARQQEAQLPASGKVLAREMVKSDMTKRQEATPYARYASGEYIVTVEDFGGDRIGAQLYSVIRSRGTTSIERAPTEMLEHVAFDKINQKAIALYNATMADRGQGGLMFSRGTTTGMPENKAPGPQGDAQQGASTGNAVTSKWFTEDNRLSNLSQTGASWQRIRENNPVLRGKSVDDTITVYRATIGDSIRPDDYVAVDKSTLRTELKNVRERDGKAAKIVSMQVQVRDLLMGNDATEFVFFPEQKTEAQDTDENTGLPLNADGSVTIYHHTSAAAAAAIRRTGTLKSKAEPDVYVTTHRETDTGYGDTAVAIRIDPARLQIDDEFPNGRKDFRLNVGRPGGSIRVELENEQSAPASQGAINRSFAGAKATTPIAAIRQAITSAYGNLLQRLESKGLVTLTQTQGEAIEAAARARADKTGGDVGAIRQSLAAVISVPDKIQTMTEDEARKQGFTLKAYRGISKSNPFNDSGTTWLTTSREVAEAYAEEVMGYDDPDVLEVMVKPDGLPRHDASRLTDEQREAFGADEFGNPQAPGIYDRSDDHPLGGSRGNVTVIHAPREAVVVLGGNATAASSDLANPDIRRSADGAIEGFFDPQTGQSFLIADNLTAESAPGTLMHEVGIHMAADSKLQPLFDRAAQLLKVGRGNAFIQRVQARMDRSGETSGEEAAAYIVTEYENDRASAPASVSKWVQDFTAAVRAWLFGKGVLLKADQLTVADIAAVARANARSMARGDGRVGDGGRMFSKAPSTSKGAGGDTAPVGDLNEALQGRGLDQFKALDDIFALPKSKATNIQQIARDNGEEVKVRTTDLIGEKLHTLTFDNGTEIRITERKANPFGQDQQVYAFDLVDGSAVPSQIGRPGENPEDVPPTGDVWLDVSQNTPADLGAKAYNIAATFAHNTGQIFVGDPAGLSNDALRRRTEQMISSALKFGTTEHLAPHQRQVAGDANLGIPPLKWIYGDHVGNVERMIDVSLDALDNALPNERNTLSYDRATGQFRSNDGNVVQPRASTMGRPLDDYRSGVGKAQAGWRTLARAAYLRSFRGADGRAEGSGILDQSSDDAARFDGGKAGSAFADPKSRIFYSRTGSGVANNPPPIPTNAQAGLFAPSSPWELPQATRTDRLIYELQDGRIDLKRVQEAIAATGKQITEGFDARLAETLMPGRIARRTESFLSAEVKPLLESMAKNNVSQDELSDYLLARHAPERNAQIAKVNDEMPDGGAGTNSQGVLMTTQAARDHIAALTQGKRLVLELLAKRVDELTLGTREVLVREGLEKQETVDAWTGAYKHYVPLFKDEAMETPGHPIGAGVSVTGTASKRATGSTGEVTNMLAHILMQREAAITRAEKNRVAMSLYGLALTNPNAEMWTTIRPSMPSDQIANELVRMGVDPMEAEVGMQGVPTIRGVDPVSGKVVDRPNPMYKRLDNSLVVKVNGEDRVILFNASNERAVRLVRNLKNQDGVLGQLDLAGSIVGKATRYFASINTQYNPAFGMVNIVRDVGGAMVNLTDTALAGKQARVLSDSIPAMIGIARDLRGDAQRTPWSDLWTQFQDDGGRTGYRDLFIDPYKRADAVQSELDKLGKDGKLTPGAAAHAVLDLLDGFNTTLENGVRLSAYKAALDQGMSRAESARLARELTLDFNRKGRAGREMGPLFAFFNASVQGTARTLKALQGPAGKRILVGGLSLGVIQALLLSMAGYEDDEIPEFVKARAFIIPLAGKQYITIPLQFGLNALPNTGRVVTELLMSGGKDWGEKSFNALGELAGSFNPLGGGNIFTGAGALKTISPTVVDPIVDMATNTDFTGKPIGKERMPWDTRPGFTMGREGTQRSFTGQAYIGISKAINSLTGGNDFAQGLASPSPEEVRYVFTTVGGGVFREMEKILNASVLTAQGEDLKAREVPLGSRFAGEVEDQDLQRSRFFKNSSKIEKLEAQLKGLSKEGRGDEVRKLIDDSPLVKLYELNDEVRSNVTKLNKLASESINDKEALKRIDAARTTYMRELNDKVLEMEKAGEN